MSYDYIVRARGSRFGRGRWWRLSMSRCGGMDQGGRSWGRRWRPMPEA